MAEEILLIDDEEGIRKVLGISLMDSGYTVLTAANGEEALRIFQERHTPIVLTDIKMPGMDGIELLRKIKQESPDTEVIMITGHGDMDLAIRSLKFDATDFITKPIHDEALEIALKRAQERISLRNQLKEYTENLERLVEEKTQKLMETERLAAIGETVAGLAHAIKNVTGGLSGGIFVLEKGIELNNKRYLRNGWEMVKGNVDRIRSMALDLLNYSARREPEYRLLDPNEPVREVVVLMGLRARESGIVLEMDLDEGLPKTWLDPEGIHRCLLDLVNNAIDACREVEPSERTGRIVLRSRKVRGWAAEYRIEDNGCGMDEETKKGVFHRFFTTKGSRGTGLGLMMTQKIVREQGGVISLESELGKGTTFIIQVPHRSVHS